MRQSEGERGGAGERASRRDSEGEERREVGKPTPWADVLWERRGGGKGEGKGEREGVKEGSREAHVMSLTFQQAPLPQKEN